LVVDPDDATEVRSVQPAGGVTVAVASRRDTVAIMRFPAATPVGVATESGEPVLVLPVPPGDPTMAIGSITYGVGKVRSSSASTSDVRRPERSSVQCAPAGVTSRPCAS
jgi:hypothetical protein